MKNILTIANELKVNKVCVNGHLKDIRQYNKIPFMVIPSKFDIQKETIFYEPILYCYTN